MPSLIKKTINLTAFACIGFIAACASKPQLPDFKYTEEAISHARKSFRQSHKEILFLLMVDRNGKVVKSQIIDWKKDDLKRTNVEKFKRSTYNIEFKPAKDSEPDYRQLFYPMNVNSTFEWR
ncbi:hypothetical protein [Sessilibacter corallicola]|uniref:hypothetical protein n=1 Tax=Sessilibacter corallicola TaxID=2904075 RepID=UPI001E51226E|nr:hypothetical protein [Sessilibacter corallicola]MCE2029328.1 hypothetical protein [Sessilibacter corallicola]